MGAGSLTSAEQAAAAAICASLHRAYRDLRFYPADHPMARQSVEGLVGAVASFLREHGDLLFEVREDALVFDGASVYTYDAGRDNLAFLMFRDGVRSLTIYHGIEPHELESLVDCLAHADDLADLEHDLITALWEKDFAHIDYRVADPFLGGEVLREGMIDALRETVLKRLEDTVAAPGTTVDSPRWKTLEQVDPDQIDSESLVLSQQDVTRGEQSVSSLADVLDEFAEVLLELAAGGRETIQESEISGDAPAGGVASEGTLTDMTLTESDDGSPEDPLMDSLTGVAGAFLDEGDIQGVARLFERLEEMESKGWSHAVMAGEVVGQAITADHLRTILESGGQVQHEEGGQTGHLLAAIRPWITGPLLDILVEADDRSVRREILSLLGTEDGVPWRFLEPLVRDPRWYVVRNAVQLAASVPYMELTEHSQRLLAHDDVRVRREMLRAMEKIGGQAGLRAVTSALTDEDSSVRTMAARAVGREGSGEQEAVLLAQIEERGFALRPIEEVEAFLGAYADLAQDRAVHVLDKLWRKKLLSSRPVAFRAAAVRALARVRTPGGRSVLSEAAKSGEAQIQRSATFALQARASGPSETQGDQA